LKKAEHRNGISTDFFTLPNKISKVASRPTLTNIIFMSDPNSEPLLAESFEESIEQLESIVCELEKGQSSLEKIIANYESGMKLVSSCRKQLKSAELSIQKIGDLSQDSDE